MIDSKKYITIDFDLYAKELKEVAEKSYDGGIVSLKKDAQSDFKEIIEVRNSLSITPHSKESFFKQMQQKHKWILDLPGISFEL